MLLNNFFPEQADFITLRRMQTFKDMVSFTEQELKDWDVKVTGGNVQWNTKACPVDFDVSDAISDLIGETLKSMDGGKQLTANHMSLYEKFVEKTVPATNGKAEKVPA